MGLLDFIKKATDSRTYMSNSKWPDYATGYYSVESFHSNNIKPTETLDQYIAKMREFWGDYRINSHGAWSWNGKEEWYELMVSDWKKQHMVTPKSSWFEFMINDTINIELTNDKSIYYRAKIINKSNIERFNKNIGFLRDGCKHPKSNFIVERFMPGINEGFESKLQTIQILSRDIGIHQEEAFVEKNIYIHCFIKFNNNSIDITSNHVEGPIFGIKLKKK